MAEKYHISPTTGNPNKCYASKRPCPLGGQEEHYPSKEAARTAFEEGQHGSFGKESQTSSFPARLKKLSPSKFDEELFELYSESGKLERSRVFAKKTVDHYRGRTFVDKHAIEQSQAKLDEVEGRLAEVVEKMAVYNDEFNRRGRWPRAFLVNNANGHVHKSMNCSTCTRTTSYNLLTEYSGRDESEIVDDAGERACTVCYSSAPVSVFSKPSKIVTEEEKAALESRRLREEASRLKAEKVAKAAITSPTGATLTVPDGRNTFLKVKTEREAQSQAVESLVDLERYRRYEEADRSYNVDAKSHAKERFAILAEALAHKRGLSQEEVIEDLEVRAQRKIKALYK